MRRGCRTNPAAGGVCVVRGTDDDELEIVNPGGGQVGQNVLSCDREQELLLPPSVREWLPEGHLAWFVLDAVEQVDLTAFYADDRDDGWGRAAHDPAMMVGLLLYAYAVGERSARRMERRCYQGHRVPGDLRQSRSVTMRRSRAFRARHEHALAGVFTDVLVLCAKAGVISVGLVECRWQPDRRTRLAGRDKDLSGDPPRGRADTRGGGPSRCRRQRPVRPGAWRRVAA